MVMQSVRAARRQHSEDGTSVVEMAFVLPLLLLLVFAIGDFGIAYTRWNSLTNAVREGARVGVVFRAPCNAAAVTAEIQNTVSNFAASSGLDGPSIVTTVANVCGGTGTQLTITGTIPYNYIAMSALAGLAPSINLSARTVMRNE
jgi:Flp pilus assembly protein TadG